MVLTIFRKDFRLLWPGAAIVILLQAALAIFEYVKGPFGDNRKTLEFNKLAESEHVIEGIVLIGIALLISLVVHQDAVPQIDLDWLVRPIKRRQLAAAKMVFFIAAIQVPMFVLDLIGCRASGFDLGHSLISALSRNLFFLIGFTVPFFSIAAMTRNAIEFIVGIGLAIAGVELMDRLFQYSFGIIPLNSVFRDPLDESNWIVVTAKYLLIAIASATVLYLQYGKRKTRASRLLFLPALLLGFAASYLPWQALAGVEQAVSGANPPGASIKFDLDVAKANVRVSENGTESRITIPIEVDGLPEGDRLVMDWGASSITVDGQSQDGGAWVDSDLAGPWLSSRGLSGQAGLGVSLPRQEVERLKSLPAVDIAVDMAVAVVEPVGSETDFTVSEEYAPRPALGRCRVRDPGRQVLHVSLIAECAQAGRVADVTAMAAFAPGQTEPYAIGMTRFGHSPFFAQFLPDAVNRVAVGMVPTTEQATADLYPNSHIVMRNYRAVAHRKVHLVLKGVRLQDWMP